MHAPSSITATIRITDLKAASQALRAAAQEQGPLAHITVLNLLAKSLGLGEDFSGAVHRGKATGTITSSHLAAPLEPTAPHHEPLGLFTNYEGALLIAPMSRAQHVLDHHPGFHPAPIIATFEPQAWVNDYAVPVDPEGPTSFDATDYVLRSDLDALHTGGFDHAFEYGDALIQASTAPTWMADHAGPFTCSVDEFLLAHLAQAHAEGSIIRIG